MNIVICEDSISDRHKLEKVITKVLIKNNLNSEIILSTNNSADVLNYANKNNQITLYFLDINLHEKFISGIDIANVIRETDEMSILQVLCKYKIVQKNLFKWTELNSVRFYVIRKISTCQ